MPDCPICGNKFPNIESMHAHMLTAHSDHGMTKPIEPPKATDEGAEDITDQFNKAKETDTL